jgi:hypothetical protein
MLLSTFIMAQVLTDQTFRAQGCFTAPYGSSRRALQKLLDQDEE